MAIIFQWVRSEQALVEYEQAGWTCVGRRWQASTDRWSYLMRRDVVIRKPSWIRRILAFLTRTFWLPCPLCGKPFGGYENDTGHMMTGPGIGVMICPDCNHRGERE